MQCLVIYERDKTFSAALTPVPKEKSRNLLMPALFGLTDDVIIAAIFYFDDNNHLQAFVVADSWTQMSLEELNAVIG